MKCILEYFTGGTFCRWFFISLLGRYGIVCKSPTNLLQSRKLPLNNLNSSSGNFRIPVVKFHQAWYLTSEKTKNLPNIKRPVKNCPLKKQL